jgi:hypothetical protein
LNLERVIRESFGKFNQTIDESGMKYFEAHLGAIVKGRDKNTGQFNYLKGDKDEWNNNDLNRAWINLKKNAEYNIILTALTGFGTETNDFASIIIINDRPVSIYSIFKKMIGATRIQVSDNKTNKIFSIIEKGGYETANDLINARKDIYTTVTEGEIAARKDGASKQEIIEKRQNTTYDKINLLYKTKIQVNLRFTALFKAFDNK